MVLIQILTLIFTFFYQSLSYGHTADVSNAQITWKSNTSITVQIEKIYFSTLLDLPKNEVPSLKRNSTLNPLESKDVELKIKNQIYLVTDSGQKLKQSAINYLKNGDDFDVQLEFKSLPENREFELYAHENLGTLIATVSSKNPQMSQKKLITANQRVISLKTNTTQKVSLLTTVFQYIKLGFIHIIPAGLDHILFILALFFLSPKLKPLLFQVTAFTIAHSMTLALVSLKLMGSNPNIVEPLIALSIAFVAVENLFVSKMHWWRYIFIIAFGLLHGMGFAGVLGELGWPANQTFAALLSFNVGVEIGQLTVLGLAYLGFLAWIKKPYFKRTCAIPCSLIIGAVGLYWTIERVVAI